MPWDSDVDVHVAEDTMHFLASYYNMTIHTVRTSYAPQGKNYMLEINPKWVDGSPDDELNQIDARWIDMLSGVFIDITAVRRKRKQAGILFCKDRHRYRVPSKRPAKSRTPAYVADAIQMAQFETNFSTSPVQTTTSPPIPQSSSTNTSGPSTTPKSRQHTASPPTDGTNGTSSVPQPNPRSCVTCRKRKVRCDKQHPCSNCTKAAIDCVFPGPGRAPRRSRKPPDAELLARLRRLEGVVQHLGKNLDEEGEKIDDDVRDKAITTDGVGNGDTKAPTEEKKIPNSCGLFNGPEPRKKSVDGVGKEFGHLVVDEGRSRYVSNKFWNSLSEEVSTLPFASPPLASAPVRMKTTLRRIPLSGGRLSSLFTRAIRLGYTFSLGSDVSRREIVQDMMGILYRNANILP
ncbi:MAG: hypothetical protein Q9201_003680 [Fulgogasparrea decipioides]